MKLRYIKTFNDPNNYFINNITIGYRSGFSSFTNPNGPIKQYFLENVPRNTRIGLSIYSNKISFHI